MPIVNVTYTLEERNIIITELIDLILDPDTPSNHIVYLAFNVSSTWGYDVGTALNTSAPADYTTKELVLITGPSDGPMNTPLREIMHERLLVVFDEMIQAYEDIVSS